MSNMKRTLLQSAYVLHRRPFRETSFIVELFTPDYGRVAVIAKGVRKARSGTQGLLQAFTPLIVSWSGKSELMTLTSIELKAEPRQLHGDCLYAGFYLNELILALLQKWDAYAKLFADYEDTIKRLQGGVLHESDLRSFEFGLLTELGYGLLASDDISLQESLIPEHYYRYVPEQGFVLSGNRDAALPLSIEFSGKHLLAIANKEWQEEGVLNAAKRLIRLVLTPLLGNRQINSRLLFASQEKVT